MKKVYFLSAAFAALALASCSSDDFLNEVPNEPVAKKELISFVSDNSRNTRGNITGEAAATLLNNNFVVYATKGTGTPTVVMDNYNVKYEGAASAGSTDTNPKGWEYVGYTSLQGADQDAKYWDFSAPQYDFVAVAGLGTSEKITSTNAGFTVAVTDPAQMTGIYFADRVSAKPNAEAATATTPKYEAYKDVITFEFRRLNAKMRVGFYETIPGYAVRNLKFYYTTAAGGSGTVGMGGDYPVSGNFDISYDALNKAHAAFDPTATTSKHHRYNTFGRLEYTNALNKMGDASKPYLAADGTATAADNKQFLGTTSTTATWAVGDWTVDHSATPVHTAWKPILPFETNPTEITLRVNYELVSVDGSKETIYVRNATAKVPVEYCQWKPNYAYTYLFKITDNTNGTTTPDPGVDPDPDTPDPTPIIPDPTDPDNPDPTDPDPSNPDDPDNPIITPDPNAGLFPITFDACVVEETDFQETITTVATPSITTYAEGSDVVGNDEYVVGEKIVLSVPAGYTPLAWEVVVSSTAITELSAESQDKAGKLTGWTGLGGNVLTPTAAGYHIVRMTWNDGTGIRRAYKVIKVN